MCTSTVRLRKSIPWDHYITRLFVIQTGSFINAPYDNFRAIVHGLVHTAKVNRDRKKIFVYSLFCCYAKSVALTTMQGVGGREASKRG